MDLDYYEHYLNLMLQWKNITTEMFPGDVKEMAALYLELSAAPLTRTITNIICTSCGNGKTSLLTCFQVM